MAGSRTESLAQRLAMLRARSRRYRAPQPKAEPKAYPAAEKVGSQAARRRVKQMKRSAGQWLTIRHFCADDHDVSVPLDDEGE